MLTLENIKLINFLSHYETKLVFKEDGKLLLTGKSGSGKSTIVEAIIWALYGKGRSDNRSLIRRGTKSATVSLKLNDGKLDTLITRTVSGAGKNTLTVTQNTGSTGQFIAIERTGLKDIQEWIEKDLLKSSYELFTNSVAYPQENENSFVKANASRRKDLLLEIVGAGNFEKLYEKTRQALTEKEKENAVSISKTTSLEISIDQGKEVVGKIDEHAKNFEKFSNELETYNLLIKDLEKRAINISNITKQITDKKSVCEMIEKSLLEIEEQQKKDEYAIRDHEKIDIEKAKKNVKELEDVTKRGEEIEQALKDGAERQMKVNAHLANKPQITDFTREIELINERLIPLVQQSGECPSGDKCPFVVPIKGQIAFLTQQIENKTSQNKREKQDMLGWEKIYASFAPLKDTDELYKELKEVKERSGLLSESKQVIFRYELFDKTLKEIKEREEKVKIDTKKYISDLAVVNKEIKEYEEELKKTDPNQINIDLANINMSVRTAQQAKEQASAELIVATKTKEYIETALSELSELQKGMSKAKEEREPLELLREALSPKGVKAVAVDYIIPELETRINSILEQLSDFRIRLDTQQSKVKEGDGVKEGLFITVKTPEGVELPLSNLSGGETVKVSMAISEGLASLMKNVGFRILDECVNALDSESTSSFTEVILKLQEQFPQLLVISHLNEIKDLFVNDIKLIKVNGISKITK